MTEPRTARSRFPAKANFLQPINSHSAVVSRRLVQTPRRMTDRWFRATTIVAWILCLIYCLWAWPQVLLADAVAEATVSSGAVLVVAGAPQASEMSASPGDDSEVVIKDGLTDTSEEMTSGEAKGAAGEADEFRIPEDALARPREGRRLVTATPWVQGLIGIYCGAVILASLIGGMLPQLIRLTHTRMQTITSLVGGLMLGIGLFHLLPHAVHSGLTVDAAAMWMMGGILSMFLLIRLFHFHHHGPLEIATEREIACDHKLPHDHDHDHDHGGESVADRSAAETLSESQGPAITESGAPHCHHAHQLSWVGILVGLSLHTMIDGIALAASVQNEASHAGLWLPAGLGTFLAIVLHKPLDAVSITALMTGAGWKSGTRQMVNTAFAMMCPVGAVLFLFGLNEWFAEPAGVVARVLAFSAGVFLCISLSDLLPEMEFHSHNRFQLTLALIAGILLAWGIAFLEPAHQHGQATSTATEPVSG